MSRNLAIGNRQSEMSAWRLDCDHSSVEFSVKKLLFFTVKGKFSDLNGVIELDEDAVSASEVKATIGVKSLNTGNEQRDRQLRAASFLDVVNFPQIEFQSVEVGPGTDRDTLKVKGALTIKGNRKDVVLNVTKVDRSKSPNGQEVVYYVGETEIDRYEFGVNGLRGLVGPKLKVVINIQANREG
ncbi:MAG TPA: YceI family protein [Pyrinomonadaceae bacterium]